MNERQAESQANHRRVSELEEESAATRKAHHIVVMDLDRAQVLWGCVFHSFAFYRKKMQEEHSEYFL